MNTNPLFGRKWNLTLLGPANSATQTQPAMVISSDTFINPLRITFDIRTVWFQWYWVAEIRIYNMAEDATQWILSNGGQNQPTTGPTAGTQNPPIQQGLQVQLSAGYQAPGQYGLIWDGFVLQPMFDRENQTDFVITLHCIIGLDENSRNSLGLTFKAGTDQLQIVRQMAESCFHPLTTTQDSVAASLAGKSLSRAKTVFGTPGKYFTEIVRNNNMQWWLDRHGLFNVGDLNKNFPTQPKYTFTPQTGIVGTPTQTQLGVNCRLLLNPNVIVSNPPMAFAIDNTVIQQLQKQPGNLSSQSLLSPNGTYVVVGATYRGDTRGQDWYTDVVGWLTAYDKVAAIAAATGVQFDRP